MGGRLLHWWETREPRTRVLVAIPVAFVVLFLFHQFFPLLDTSDRLMYAAMEAVPLALLIAWATQNELRRRAEAQARAQANGDGDGDGASGSGPDA